MGFDDFIHKFRKSLHKFEIYGSVVRQNLTAAEPVSAPFIVPLIKGDRWNNGGEKTIGREEVTWPAETGHVTKCIFRIDL
jgi:hypothetical protein